MGGALQGRGGLVSQTRIFCEHFYRALTRIFEVSNRDMYLTYTREKYNKLVEVFQTKVQEKFKPHKFPLCACGEMTSLCNFYPQNIYILQMVSLTFN